MDEPKKPMQLDDPRIKKIMDDYYGQFIRDLAEELMQDSTLIREAFPDGRL